MDNNPNEVVQLSDDERALVVQRKAACPFIGSAVAQGLLPVRNDARNPLASIEEVRALGNTGGGNLGDVLVMFASGNHALMRGDSGKLDQRAPAGLFSLEFPGSQGSHPGHSGILEGDPAVPDSGRLSEADFERLTSRAKDGLITRSEVGRFIAENLLRDPQSKVSGIETVELLARDAGQLAEAIAEAIASALLSHLPFFHKDAPHRKIAEKFTKLMGEENLIGSAGEFGLLFAFLANKPGAQKIKGEKGEPAVAVEDLKAMFVEKRLPDGWETWKKTRKDWIENTLELARSAAKEYHALKGTH